jgi:hypothetical protein
VSLQIKENISTTAATTTTTTTRATSLSIKFETK